MASELLLFGYYRAMGTDPPSELVNLTHAFYNIARGRYLYSIHIADAEYNHRNIDYEHLRFKIIDLQSDNHGCSAYSIQRKGITDAPSNFIHKFTNGNCLISNHLYGHLSIIDPSISEHNTFTEYVIKPFLPDSIRVGTVSFVQNEDEIVCIGYVGRYSHEIHSDVYSFNLGTLKWRKCEDISYAPNPAIFSSCLLIKDRKLFIIGGVADDANERRGEVNNASLVNLDDINKKVTTLNSMNHGRAGLHGDTCLMNDGRIVVGGVSSEDWDDCVSSIEFYDVPKNKWTDYKHKTKQSHSGTALWCRESVIMIAGYNWSNYMENIGNIEWVDVRENGKWKFWDEKTLAVLLDCDPTKKHLSLSLLV